MSKPSEIAAEDLPPPEVGAWNRARSLVEVWESDFSFGPTQVNLHPASRASLIRRVAEALLEKPAA